MQAWFSGIACTAVTCAWLFLLPQVINRIGWCLHRHWIWRLGQSSLPRQTTFKTQTPRGRSKVPLDGLAHYFSCLARAERDGWRQCRLVQGSSRAIKLFALGFGTAGGMSLALATRRPGTERSGWLDQTPHRVESLPAAPTPRHGANGSTTDQSLVRQRQAGRGATGFTGRRLLALQAARRQAEGIWGLQVQPDWEQHDFGGLDFRGCLPRAPGAQAP